MTNYIRFVEDTFIFGLFTLGYWAEHRYVCFVKLIPVRYPLPSINIFLPHVIYLVML
jgi:hypothetical protein